jgi:hypothetical protein
VSRLLVLVCVLAGCDVVWRLDDLRGDGGGDTPPDSGDGDAADRCANELRDDFAGTTIKQHWLKFGESAEATVAQAEMLLIRVQTSASATVGVKSNLRYTLEAGGTIDVEVIQPTVTAPGGYVETYLAAREDMANGYGIDVAGPNIEFKRIVGGTLNTTTRTYEPTQHRFWRIEHGPGPSEVTFSTSADGSSWFTQVKLASDRFANLQVELGLASFGVTTTTSALFDNFAMCGFRAE